MSIDLVTALGPGLGRRFVPEYEPGTLLSDTFVEAEHHGPPVSGGATVAFWEGEPGALRLSPWPYDELCVILTGRVALVDDDGNRREFGAGEAFLVPRTFSGVWETIEPTTKIFVAFPTEEA